MAPAHGRPAPENPKRNNVIIRLTDADREKLDYAADTLGMRKSDVLRHGIEIMYQKAKEKE